MVPALFLIVASVDAASVLSGVPVMSCFRSVWPVMRTPTTAVRIDETIAPMYP